MMIILGKVTWTNVSPIAPNSIFLAEDGDVFETIGLQTFTGLNFISDQLLGITTNPGNDGFADIRIDPRWFRDRTPGGGGGIYTTGTVGIGLTQPRLGPVGILTDVKLDVLGDAIFTGVVSATSFTGEFNVDTKDLNVSGIASFTGTTDNVIGDTNTGIVQINGGVGIDKSVSIGASLFVNNNVGIGTSTNLDGNALTVNGGDVDILGDDTTVKIGTAITISNGIVSATTFDGKFLDVEFLNVTGIATIKTGIVTNLSVSGLSTFNDTARFDGAVNIFDDLFVSGNISVGGEGVTLDTESIRIEGKELLIGFTTAITPNDTTANSAGISIASTEGYSLADLEVPGVNVTFNATITDRPATIATGAATTIGITTNSISLGQVVRGNFVSTGTTVTSIGSEVIGLSTETSNTVGGITALDFGTITSTPNTYKQFKWFKNGTFVGQGTDAFISNQPISIGGTQIGNGQLFAVGDNINFTEDEITTKDLKVTGNAVIDNNTQTKDLKVTGVSTFVGLSTFTNVGIGTTNVIGNDKLSIIGDARLGGENDTLSVGNSITMSAGIITALKLEGEGGTIIDISGGGTVITGIVTIGESSITLDGTNGTESIVIGSGITLSAVSVSTFANSVDINGDLDVNSVKISAGVVTATTGIVTYYGDGQYLENIISGVGIQSSGTIIGTGFTTLNFIGTGNTIVSIGNTVNISINSSQFAGFAQTAGIATNLANGAGGEIVYQSAADTTAFLSNGTVGQVLVSNGGTNAPQWADGASTGAIDGITIQDEGSIVGSGGSISTLNFKGNGVTATASGNISTITVTIPSIPDVNGSAGIASTARDVIGGIASVTSLSVSGISTLGTVEINVGVITATSGIVTYYGDGQYLDNIITENEISNQSVAFAQTAGIATNVIGGIASVTSLSVNTTGISTLGTVKIDAGIITSTTGTPVTYFGNLTGTASTASFATTAFTLNNRVESDFNVAFATTAGIATNVIGGIASVTSLSVNTTGISTLGVVKISAGIITNTSAGVAVTVFGNLTGTASTASFATTAFTLNNRVESDFNVAFAQTAGLSTETTRLQTARTFELTGDVVASQISFDGTGNVSLAATIQPNSVALGGDTTGDYVSSISGTGNQITVTSGTGEGSTPVISIPNNPTLPGTTVTVETDLQVNRNLNVTGNVTIGGTSATLFTETLKISDPDIIVGFRTDAGGNDISNDTTASHGGIAVASTEGSPIVSFIGGGGTVPVTYKKIFWFESGAFTGLATDAWLTNYAFGVGTTSMSAGTKFAVGNIETDFDDIKSVRNINASGISTLGTVKISAGIVTSTTGTAVSFFGNLTGTASTASFATTAFTLNNRVESDFNVAFATTAGIATNVIGGIASVTSLSVNTTGISTLGTVKISAGIVTSTTGTAVSFFGNLTGTASTASFATTAFTLNNRVESDFNVAFATTAGIATYTSEWIIAANGTSDYRFTGPGFTGSENDPTIYLTRGEQYKFTNNLGAHPFQIQRQFQNTGGTAYNDGIVNNGVSNGTLTWNVRMDAPDILYYQCTSHTNMSGKIYIVNAGIASDVNLFTTGISTLGTVKISAGIVTSTTGTAVSFFGNLTGTASTASFATTAFTLNNRVESDFSVAFATTAGIATNVKVVDESSDTTCFPLFVTAATGDLAPKSGSNLTFNSSDGTLSATEFSGGGSNLTGLTGASASTYGDASNVAQIVVDANGRITGISNVAISGGVTIENNGSPVGTAITTINFSSNVTATASGSIATITSSGGGDGGSGTFDTGITTSIYVSVNGGIGTAQAGLTTVAANNDIFIGPGIAYSFPSTAGKSYVIESIHVTNIYNTNLYFTSRHDFNGGQNVPTTQRVVVPYQGSLELLEEPIIAKPSDILSFQALNGVGTTATGVNNGLDSFIIYSEKTDTDYIGTGVTVTTPAGTEMFTSNTNPSVIQSIRLCNYDLNIDVDASVSIYRGGSVGGILTTGVRQGYLVYNMTVPKNSVIEILERPKYIAANDTIVVGIAGTTLTDSLSATLSGKYIT